RRCGRRRGALRLRGAPVVGVHVCPVLLRVALDVDGLAGRAVLALGALGPFAALAGVRRVRGTVRRAVAACEYGAAPRQPDDGSQGRQQALHRLPPSGISPCGPISVASGAPNASSLKSRSSTRPCGLMSEWMSDYRTPRT